MCVCVCVYTCLSVCKGYINLTERVLMANSTSYTMRGLGMCSESTVEGDCDGYNSMTMFGNVKGCSTASATTTTTIFLTSTKFRKIINSKLSTTM